MANILTFPTANVETLPPVVTWNTPAPVTGITFDNRKSPAEMAGKDVSASKSVAEALMMSGLNWKVEQHSLIDSKSRLVVPGIKHNVRDYDGASLGIVSNSYKVVQNSQGFDFVDEILGHQGITLATAGEASNGKKVWLQAEMPEMTILGEPVDPYIVFVNQHDGKGGIRIMITPIRLWCKNQMNFAIKKASRSWSTQHKGAVEWKMQEAKRTILGANEYMKALETEAEILAKIKMDDAAVRTAIETLIPLPKDSDNKRKLQNAEECRAELMYRYKNADDLNNIRGTAYGFLNAVSDYTSHAIPKRMTKDYWENNMIRLASGGSMIDKAYDIVKVA